MECSCPELLDSCAARKNRRLEWTFELSCGQQVLLHVALLNDTNRRHFRIDYVKHASFHHENGDRENSSVQMVKTFEMEDGLQVSVS